MGQKSPDNAHVHLPGQINANLSINVSHRGESAHIDSLLPHCGEPVSIHHSPDTDVDMSVSCDSTGPMQRQESMPVPLEVGIDRENSMFGSLAVDGYSPMLPAESIQIAATQTIATSPNREYQYSPDGALDLSAAAASKQKVEAWLASMDPSADNARSSGQGLSRSRGKSGASKHKLSHTDESNGGPSKKQTHHHVSSVPYRTLTQEDIEKFNALTSHEKSKLLHHPEALRMVIPGADPSKLAAFAESDVTYAQSLDTSGLAHSFGRRPFVDQHENHNEESSVYSKKHAMSTIEKSTGESRFESYPKASSDSNRRGHRQTNSWPRDSKTIKHDKPKVQEFVEMDVFKRHAHDVGHVIPDRSMTCSPYTEQSSQHDQGPESMEELNRKMTAMSMSMPNGMQPSSHSKG